MSASLTESVRERVNHCLRLPVMGAEDYLRHNDDNPAADLTGQMIAYLYDRAEHLRQFVQAVHGLPVVIKGSRITRIDPTADRHGGWRLETKIDVAGPTDGFYPDGGGEFVEFEEVRRYAATLTR